jgi:endonuclease-3
MAHQSKSQFLNEVHTHLKRRYKRKPEKAPGRLTILEAVVYGICHEDTTREQANQALSRFKDQFFDWNEVRVSPIVEVQETLVDIPDPEGRARRIRRFLRQLFAKTYGFNLEPLTKKPLKEALKVLHGYEAFSSDYVAATVVQQALGGHAIPVDASSRRALERLGIAELDIPTLRAVLERAVPKNRGAEFADLIEDLAHDTCVAGIPDCPRCELRKICPTAQARKHEAAAASKAGSKPAPAPPPAAAEPAKASRKKDKEPLKAKEPGRPGQAAAPPAKQPPSKQAQAPAAKQPPAPPARPPRTPPKPPPGKRGSSK